MLNKNKKNVPESGTTILCQVGPSLLVAGLGMLMAGILLERVQSSPAFSRIPGIVILVPALLGLKGNLEMTMASRISSIANLGLLSTNEQRHSAFRANMALIQCQSIIVGCSAALFSSTISYVSGAFISWKDLIVLASTAVGTACLASFILAFAMMRIINWSLDREINPDNVATPIAAALGDFATLAILQVVAGVCSQLSPLYLLLAIGVMFRLLPYLWSVAQENQQTEVALKEGWFPVISAMLISSIGGTVLERSLHHFPSIAVYQPLVNGVGGNLAAIATSRLSSSLHIEMLEKSSSSSSSSISIQSSINPIRFLVHPPETAKVNRILLSLVIPSQCLFVCLLSFLQNTSLYHPLIGCLSASFIQVYILLFLVENILVFAHRNGFDPDNFGIPFLTAFGDLIGCASMFIAFTCLS